MKRFWISLAALGLCFALTLWNTAYVTRVTDSIAAQLAAAQEAVEGEEWQRAQALTEKAQHAWERYDRFFSMVLRHADADDVNTTFKEVCGYLDCRAAAEYTAVNSALMEKVRHVAEMEKLTWSNLL